MNEERSTPPVQVLFVDDEPNIIRSLKRLFWDEPVEVLCATSGLEGLEAIRTSTNLALIVSDQRMPGLTGVDFLEQARQMAPEALRMVLTGYADVEAAMGAINRGGAYRYISKPWVDKELVQTVREAVGIFLLKQENVRLNETIQEQNEMLEGWNLRLKNRVLEQTRDIVKKNEELFVLNSRLRRNFDDSIEIFASLMELRDQKSQSHSKRVAEMAALTARHLGMKAEEEKTIHTAGLLHDIGKIGISDALLTKQAHAMEPEEFEEYIQHAVRGQAAIDAIEDLRGIGVLIRHHHERFDGQGRPDGLDRENIPMGSRIICLADFVDRTITGDFGGDIITHIQSRLAEEAGALIDPALVGLIEILLEEVYGRFEMEQEVVEVEIDPGKLLEGMVLARRAVSGTGVLLLEKDNVLTEEAIHALQRYYLLDPSQNGIYVWQKKECLI